MKIRSYKCSFGEQNKSQEIPASSIVFSLFLLCFSESILWVQRRCPKWWECWSACVSQGPGGGTLPSSGGCPDLYLRTIYVAQGPYRSPGQAAAPTSSKHPRSTTTSTTNQRESRTKQRKDDFEDNLRDGKYEAKLEKPSKHLLYLSQSQKRYMQLLFWGPGHRQWLDIDTGVREVSEKKVFCPIPLWLGSR